jgi:hypothetical protein
MLGSAAVWSGETPMDSARHKHSREAQASAEQQVSPPAFAGAEDEGLGMTLRERIPSKRRRLRKRGRRTKTERPDQPSDNIDNRRTATDAVG